MGARDTGGGARRLLRGSARGRNWPVVQHDHDVRGGDRGSHPIRLRGMRSAKLALVAGGGGFIGGHLVAELRRRGYDRIRSVDIKPIDSWYQAFDDVENLVLDLRNREACEQAVDGASDVFNLAADMGGMGFIETHKADCMVSVLINTEMLIASREAGVDRFLFGSSACVYAADKQT